MGFVSGCYIWADPCLAEHIWVDSYACLS